MNVGIWGVGSYLPEQVRTNDWWPEHITEKWISKQKSSEDDFALETLTEAQRATLAATAALSHDPFRGSVERRIMPEDMLASEMETRAARAAMEAAKVDPSEIDLILVQSTLPDFLHTPNVSIVHKNLGLPYHCFAMSTEGMCNAFALQLMLASSMIESGRAKRALIIQSSNLTRLTPIETPGSAWVGDGAAAAVIGPVREGFGVLGNGHSADGDLYGALVTGVPNSRWWKGGRFRFTHLTRVS